MRGNTLMGFVGGLLAGLLLAVAVALYITNAPIPFVNKVQRPTETIVPGTIDPNRGLNAVVPPFSPTPATATDVPPKDAAKSDPKAAVPPGSAANAASTAAAGAAAPAAAGKDAATEDSTRYLLQAGAFKSAEEAEAMRAKLGMLGMDARVVERAQEGGSGKLYRVRLGPYGRVDEIDRIRRVLAENGIDAQLMKVR